MEFTTSALVAVFIALTYCNWLYLGYINRHKINPKFYQALSATLGLGIVASLWNIVPLDTDLAASVFPAEVALYLSTLLLIAYSVLSFLYLQSEKQVKPVLVLSGVWWVVTTVLGMLSAVVALGSANWLVEAVERPDVGGILVLVGWAVLSLTVLILAFYRFYKATLPEVANRSMIWAIMTPLVSMGGLLSISGSEGVRETGWIIQVLGLGMVTYSVISVSSFDIKRATRLFAANAVLTVVMAVVLFSILFGAEQLRDENINRNLLFVGMAIGAAILFTPIYGFAQNQLHRYLHPQVDEITPEIRRFAEAITGVVELDQLANVVMQTLRDVMGVKRGALLLVTTGEGNTLRLEPHEKTMGEVPFNAGYMLIDQPVYNTLYRERTPLLQFDIDFSPKFAQIPSYERQFFRAMLMAAYAPIVVQNRLVGVLACGPKSNDQRFTATDLEVLSTIANQTGIALRNARLVEDVLKRERDIAEANKRLEVAKRQLEALDSVKTDFITIASHELRTPLAQIRGHTDIIQALNEQGMLDQDQLGSLTNNLRKAADRLETLIGDMLDVSQLDLSAMDLRFAQVTVENAVRLAVEPLQESIRNRKQSLTARGLRGLPPIEADMQRLVQAIRNMVLNAVKFTPDGGRIDIIGTLMHNDDSGKDEIQIAIKDTGIGIDPKNHEAVFEKFFRAFDPGLHSTGSTKFMGAGPGLGLTIAKGVIEGHGGRIWVESAGFDADKLPGSTFHIIIPTIPPEGARRVVSITGALKASEVQAVVASPSASPTAATASKPAPTAPTPTPEPALTDESGAFVEPNPTMLNPSANRAGLTAAAMAAAEQALKEEDGEKKEE